MIEIKKRYLRCLVEKLSSENTRRCFRFLLYTLMKLDIFEFEHVDFLTAFYSQESQKTGAEFYADAYGHDS